MEGGETQDGDRQINEETNIDRNLQAWEIDSEADNSRTGTGRENEGVQAQQREEEEEEEQTTVGDERRAPEGGARSEETGGRQPPTGTDEERAGHDLWEDTETWRRHAIQIDISGYGWEAAPTYPDLESMATEGITYYGIGRGESINRQA